MLKKKYQIQLRSVFSIFRVEKKTSRSIGAYLRLCLPFALVSSTVILERNIDVLMLGSLDSTDSSALYYISTRISAFLLLPLLVLNSIALPIVSRGFNKGKMDIVQKNAKRVSIYSSTVTALVLAVVFVFGNQALLLFGEEYSSAYYPMLLLCVGNFIRTLIGPVQMVGLMCNMEKMVSKANMYSLFLNIVLNSILIPTIGLYGAVLATIFTRLGRSYFLSNAITRTTGVRVGVV